MACENVFSDSGKRVLQSSRTVPVQLRVKDAIEITVRRNLILESASAEIALQLQWNFRLFFRNNSLKLKSDYLSKV